MSAKLLSLTRRPVPGAVRYSRPRVAVRLKNVAGKASLLLNWAGTPSQLTPRRLVASCRPGALLLSTAPMAAANSGTWAATSPLNLVTVRRMGALPGALMSEPLSQAWASAAPNRAATAVARVNMGAFILHLLG